MAANAPYYQMRSGQFITTPNSTNATPSRFVTEDDEYAAVASPHEHQPSMYSEHAARQTSADTPMHAVEENHNLAELLQAATTAADQAAQAMGTHDAVTVRMAAQGKRKRASSSPMEDMATTPRADATIAPKRRRVDIPTDPRLQTTEADVRGNSENNTVPPSTESLLNDARAAGVHSAAALFRRSSEKTSRKYTRPPMSKLFMSLQLSPENFLQLQAQAKAYMLDTTYPERQNCVGNRGKGDTDMVKLRLFNCVRDFLNDGVGEEFFGENVEKPGEREAIEAARALGEDKAPNTEERLTWPRDGNKIISLVTPLMRRMVTNERQRMYAIETRKGGAKKKDKEGSAEAGVQQVHGSPSGNSARGQSIEQQLLPAFDPNLGRVFHTSHPASPLVLSPVTPGSTAITDMGRFSRMLEDEPQVGTDLQLPTDGPANPRIKNINIFLVLADHTLPSGTVKSGVKLSEKRIGSLDPRELPKYPYDTLLCEVIALLERAKDRYTTIREHLAPLRYSYDVNDRYNGAPSTLSTIGNLNLRDLASAADAIQINSPNIGDEARAQGIVASSTVSDTNADDCTSTATMQHARTDLEPTDESQFVNTDPGFMMSQSMLLPRYKIKTIGLNGWEVIGNDAQWRDLLLRRGHEIWADGTINLIVELVDIMVPMERATGGPLVSVPATSEKGKDKKTERDVAEK